MLSHATLQFIKVLLLRPQEHHLFLRLSLLLLELVFKALQHLFEHGGRLYFRLQALVLLLEQIDLFALCLEFFRQAVKLIFNPAILRF